MQVRDFYDGSSIYSRPGNISILVYLLIFSPTNSLGEEPML